MLANACEQKQRKKSVSVSRERKVYVLQVLQVSGPTGWWWCAITATRAYGSQSGIRGRVEKLTGAAQDKPHTP